MRSQILDDLKSFCSDYFTLVGKTEAPFTYHRWSVYSSLAAMLGRQAWLPFGHGMIYPNMYVMLMGSPGARKNTAIGIAQKLLLRVGYDKFSADKSSKERFLIDMLGGSEEDENELLELYIDNVASETFIVAEEFTDFLGKNNTEFLTMLGKLWDNPPQYRQPKIHGKSVFVPQPTVNMLSGNTPQAYFQNMPIESMGQGYMARVIHVHGESTGIKITRPPPPTQQSMDNMDSRFKEIKRRIHGEFKISKELEEGILTRIYKEYPEIEDYRFKYYNNRRFTHLLKLAMLMASTRYSLELTEEDVIIANTFLFYTEQKMPLSLGEFGKARNADVANAVIDILKSAKRPCTVRYIWRQVAQDLNRQEELQEIIRNLQSAGKIQLVESGGVSGYTTKFEKNGKWKEDLLHDEFLTLEERA